MKEAWLKKLRKGGFNPLQIATIDSILKEAQTNVEQEYTQKSFLMMLAIPLNVLISEWGEENEDTKDKATAFVEECLSLVDSYSSDSISYRDLADYVKEYSGLEFSAEWLEDKINKRKGEKENE